MRLSDLQRYILRSIFFSSQIRVNRSIFPKFYERRTIRPKAKDLTNIITDSLESLIDRGMLVGYGVRTTKKWYIKDVRLTLQGKKIAKKIRGEQQKLPLK